MTTWRCTWLPTHSPFPSHHDFWAQVPAENYADIKRQLGALDVGVSELPGTDEAGVALRGAETGPGATNTPARDRTGIRDDERGAESAVRFGRNA